MIHFKRILYFIWMVVTTPFIMLLGSFAYPFTLGIMHKTKVMVETLPLEERKQLFIFREYFYLFIAYMVTAIIVGLIFRYSSLGIPLHFSIPVIYWLNAIVGKFHFQSNRLNQTLGVTEH